MYTKIKAGAVLLLFTFSLAQCFFFQDTDNLICVAIAFVGSILVLFSIFKPDILQNHPISSMQILFFALGNLMLPIIITTLEQHPLIYNLAVPVQTFGNITAVSTVLLFTHLVYRSSSMLQKFRRTITRKIHAPLGLFTIPSDSQLWLMGLVGCLSTFYIAAFLPDSGQVAQGASDKFVQGLQVFTYAPFLIALSFLYSEKRPLKPLQIGGLVIYFMLIVALGMTVNTRRVFAQCFSTIAIALLLGVLTYRISLRSFNPKIVVPAILVGILFVNVMSSLALSMEMARRYRGRVSSSDLVRLSVEGLLEPNTIEKYRNERSMVKSGWDENYVKNAFLSRFVSVKFHDNILNLTNGFTAGEKEQLADMTNKRIWATLPDPLLSLFSTQMDKLKVNKMSMGDYIYYLGSGKESSLGGFRVGSFIGHGLALFGAFTFPILSVLCLCTFPLTDSFSFKRLFRPSTDLQLMPSIATPPKNGNDTLVSLGKSKFEANEPLAYSVVFAIPVLLNMYETVNYISQESFVPFFQFFIRSFPQTVLLYSVVFFLSRKACINFK